MSEQHATVAIQADRGVSPRPFRAQELRAFGTDHVVFVRIFDAHEGKVADLYPHPSVGGQGIDRVRANARLIVDLVNSMPDEAFEAFNLALLAPPESPPAERPLVMAAGRLL